MDITALSMGMSLSNVKESVRVEVTKTAKGAVKENIAVDHNIGQNLDVIAVAQKDKKEETNRKQQQELQWAKDKQQMMSIKETKMLQMREIGQAMQSKLTPQELKKLDDRLNSLAVQINAIDMDNLEVLRVNTESILQVSYQR